MKNVASTEERDPEYLGTLILDLTSQQRQAAMSSIDKVTVLEQALADIAKGVPESASNRLAAGYPFVSRTKSKRSWTQRRALSIFVRDGFIDRYTGERLVYPGALRILSLILPSVFPVHPNWKMSETHIAYWELFPTLDHLFPVATGGEDSDENLVTTSMLSNQAKSSWSLDELGWKLYPSGSIDQWDGLMGIAASLIEDRPALLNDAYLRRWHDAALSIARV